MKDAKALKLRYLKLFPDKLMRLRVEKR